MPCKHEICLICFDRMLDKTNLCCPLCRQDISTWSRAARIANRLVDMQHWKEIQQKFPVEVKNRLEGKSEQIAADSLASLIPGAKKQKCSEEGEVRKEYLEFLRKVS